MPNAETTLSSEITYRVARAEDVRPATALFVEAVQDLFRRSGLPPSAMTLESRLPAYEYIFRTGFFRLAERKGEIVGLANGTVRGDQWFLAGFWVKPGLQVQGIGKPLLRQAWAEGGEGRTCVTWSSIDFAAMASYFKLGLMPISQVLTLTAPSASVRAPSKEEEYEVRRVTTLDAELLALDRELRGIERRADLEFMLAEGARLFRVAGSRARGNLAGYFAVRDGSIGPAGWVRREDGEAIARLAIAEASRDGSKEARLMLIGLNHEALRAGLEAGLRVSATAHLLASRPFAQVERYLPSGGLLF